MFQLKEIQTMLLMVIDRQIEHPIFRMLFYGRGADAPP